MPPYRSFRETKSQRKDTIAQGCWAGVRTTLLLRCMDFSLQQLLLLQSMGSRHAGSVVVVLRL